MDHSDTILQLEYLSRSGDLEATFELARHASRYNDLTTLLQLLPRLHSPPTDWTRLKPWMHQQETLIHPHIAEVLVEFFEHRWMHNLLSMDNVLTADATPFTAHDPPRRLRDDILIVAWASGGLWAGFDLHHDMPVWIAHDQPIRWSYTERDPHWPALQKFFQEGGLPNIARMPLLCRNDDDTATVVIQHPGGQPAASIQRWRPRDVLHVIKDLAHVLRHAWRRGHHLEALGLHPTFIFLDGDEDERRLGHIVTGWRAFDIACSLVPPKVTTPGRIGMLIDKYHVMSPESGTGTALNEGSLVFVLAHLLHQWWPDNVVFLKPHNTLFEQLAYMMQGPWPERDVPPTLRQWLHQAMTRRVHERPDLNASIEVFDRTLSDIAAGWTIEGNPPSS